MNKIGLTLKQYEAKLNLVLHNEEEAKKFFETYSLKFVNRIPTFR